MSLDAISAYGVDFSAMRAKFQQADADKSGGLSLEEFAHACTDCAPGAAEPADQPGAGEIFALLDADSNGELTSGEASSTLNGNISPESFMSLLAAQESAAASGVDASAGRSQLTATYGSQEGSEDDLLGDLLDSLDDDTDEEEDVA